MPTIQGPITIKKGREGLQALAEHGVNVNLPFEASGWESKYNQELVQGSDYVADTKPVKEIGKMPDEEYDDMTVLELREVCRDMGLKVSGSKQELIKRIGKA